MDEALIGRVRQIIDETGEQQRVIAERIGIEPSKLTKSLSGARRFTSLELALLANLGGRTVDWLLTGRPSRSWTFAHRLSTLDSSSANKAGELAVRAVAEYHENLADLGFLPEAKAGRPPAVQDGSFVTAGNALAKWALGHMPRPMLGASMSELMGDVEDVFGVDVIVAELPNGCDGMSYVDEDFKVIVLAQTEVSARQRYTLAHELGHVLAGDAEQSVVRDNVSNRQSSLAERRADVFAASFLAPEDELKTALEKLDSKSEAELCFEFGISPVSLSWRLFNLGLIGEAERTSLARLSSRDVARHVGKTADQLERDRASQVARPPMRLLLGQINAFVAGQATLHPVASMLGIDLETAYDMFAEPRLESPAGNPELADA